MALHSAAFPPSQWGLLIAIAASWSKHEPDVSASLDWTQQLDHGLQYVATLLNGTQAFPSRTQGAAKAALSILRARSCSWGDGFYPFLSSARKGTWSGSEKRLMLTRSHFPRNFYCFHLEPEQNQLLLKPPGWGNFHSKNIVQEILWLFYGILIVFYYIYIIYSYVMAGTPGMP